MSEIKVCDKCGQTTHAFLVCKCYYRKLVAEEYDYFHTNFDKEQAAILAHASILLRAIDQLSDKLECEP